MAQEVNAVMAGEGNGGVIYPEVHGIGSHAPIWIIAFIIFYKHIPNIVRLFKKEEGKV